MKMQIGVAVVLSMAGLAAAQSVVVPNVNAGSPGPSNQGYPWNTGDMRYQQVFAQDQFGGLTGVIDSFAYRVDESAGNAFAAVTTQAQIWLGYSAFAPGSLSLTFDNNWASGKTMVMDGNVTFSSSGSGFDIVIDVDNAFNYDGSGDLLLEIILPNSVRSTQFDAAGTGFALGGTAWSDRLYANGWTSATGSSTGDDGMVTKFNFVPAPGAAGLIAAGGLVAVRRRR